MTKHQDGGLKNDLAKFEQFVLRRRHIIGVIAATSVGSFGCGGGTDTPPALGSGSTPPSSTSSSSTSSSGSSSGTASCSVVPSETAGPFPGDGTNSVGGVSVNALALSGVLRSDIKRSFAGATATATGIALTVKLKLKLASNGCAVAANRAVYLWHCDALGRYSMYSNGVTGENYLRGLQVTDVNGEVSFTTVYPGCYAGRWPHIHFEIFADLASATSGNNDLKTSQLALPRDTSLEVYNSSSYAGSLANLKASSLAGDGVFSDGSALQLATLTGSVGAGYVATLEIAV
jgi:protocatechuate 3,4-dioxygenase beta subunit